MDSALRDLSTHLSDVGRNARDKIQNKRSLAEAKVLWLQVYQNYYLTPPQYYASRVKEWQNALDDIAHKVKDLTELLNQQKFIECHTAILKLQSSLVGLYQPLEERGFFERHRAIISLIKLFFKVHQEGLEENQNLIETTLKKILPQHLLEAKNKSNRVESLLQNTDITHKILTMSSDEDEKMIQSLFVQIQIFVFEDEQ
ncbi:MAG: hypothetical protein H3C47_06600 [Candidatus Cloacimonetes bacterium]|nr:hypothetical protein [Candidatus Cloacimonadota bacterium]